MANQIKRYIMLATWVAVQLVFVLVPMRAVAEPDWIEALPLHITALTNCQYRIQTIYSASYNFTVVDVRAFLQEVEADFLAENNTLYTCRIGVYGGEPRIKVSTSDAPLPERFFTLIPGYPENDCYDHSIVQNYNVDPPEAIGWVSSRFC